MADMPGLHTWVIESAASECGRAWHLWQLSRHHGGLRNHPLIPVRSGLQDFAWETPLAECVRELGCRLPATNAAVLTQAWSLEIVAGDSGQDVFTFGANRRWCTENG